MSAPRDSDRPLPPAVRAVLVALGMLAVGLAALGILLPILPTTPFLLLAAYLFARSSERFYRWLHTNRWFGEYLTNYREGRGMPLRDKALTLIALWLAIGLSATYAVSSWWARGALVAIAIGVSIHLARIPNLKPAPPGATDRPVLAPADTEPG